MRGRRGLALAASGLPLVLGLAAAALLQAGWLPNLVFVGQYHADLAALAWLGGAALSGLLVLGWAARGWAARRLAQARAAEQQAEAAARRRFLQRLDHELKNPLTVIRLGLTNLAQQPALGNDPSLARLGQQAQRLQKLVKDLRALGELEEQTLERGAVALGEVLEEAVTLARIGGSAPERAERVVDVAVQQVPWPLPPVLGDRDLLVVLFSNLLDNAFKFTAPGGRVAVRATEDSHQALVEVADNGLGIPAGDLDHVYEELYRGENVREVPGSGLGLALAQRIVTLHNGVLAVRSREGQGTVVSVRLPLAGSGQ